MAASIVILGAGCFWGVQDYFDQIPGVLETTVGYSGGHLPHPTYEAVCSGKTGHAEVVQIAYDASVLRLEVMLQHFFRMHDPTQHNRQGPDVGSQYRSILFYSNQAEQAIMERIRTQQQANHSDPIVTEISPQQYFYPAEEYHQKFVQKTGRGSCHIPYQPLTSSEIG